MTTTAVAPKTWPTWAHLFQPVRKISPTETIRVEAGLHYIPGNRRPYFSVTATVTDSRRRGRDKFDRGGCLHEEIAEHFPALAPVVALHLSDDEGQPMHAEANGWYWLAGYYGDTGDSYHGGNGSIPKTPAECLAIFADHVRIPVAEAERLAMRLKVQRNEPTRFARYARWVEEQAPRWQAEAAAAIALLDLLAAGGK